MKNPKNPVFDYRALRLLVGCIALALPFVVNILTPDQLASISASYHTEARDAFVGMLFIVGSFLWAYNGHTSVEASASKFAALMAILVALFPTSCDSCSTSAVSLVHVSAATALFSTLAYYCLGPFRKNIKGNKGKKGLRSKIYLCCGVTMILSMLAIGLSHLEMFEQLAADLSVTFWAEAIALGAFGVAWIVAGKLSLFADEDEALHLLGNMRSQNK